MTPIENIHKLFLTSNGVTTDTRKIKSNTIFFGLKGDNFNGNKFALKAIELGASYAIVDEKKYAINDQFILVEDVLKTLQNLATFHRRYLNIPIVSLTGSNGKTTTKELIHVVLSKKFNTVATQGNLNNHIGVPLTLLNMNQSTEIGIVEMGANHQKEIELLCAIAEPNYGYITNFGKAHLEGFGGEEGVIKGKSELYIYLRQQEQFAFVNANDTKQLEKSEGIERILLEKKITLENESPYLNLNYKGIKIKTHLIGKYNFTNIVAALSIGTYFEVDFNEMKEAIESYIPTNNRSQIIRKGDVTIILDAYNANPSSMSVAIDSFITSNKSPKSVILGDMFELGTDSAFEHQQITTKIENENLESIYLIGENFAKSKASKALQYNTFEAFQKEFSPSKNGTYLIKGSRGMALERTLDLFD